MRPFALPWAAVLLLAACHPSSGVPPPAGEELGNLALAARSLVGAGELWLVLVSEAEQGGLDRNGDGDARDEVVFVLDLARGSLLDSALALGSDGSDPPLLACDGAAAIAVDEASQGGRDLDGDGDALDRVLHVYRREQGAFENLGLAVRAVLAGGELVAVAVDEASQGGRDLDVDGDATGSVLAVHDLRDGSTTSFGLRDSVPLAIADDHVALRLAEREGLDLSFDGDDRDQAVFEVYDARTRLLQNTTLVLSGDGLVGAGGTFGVPVDEEGFGRGDLTGDGDADDSAFYVFDPARSLSVNLGLSVPLHPPPATDGERYLLYALELPVGRDGNGDGDLDDLIVHVFEPASGLLYDTALASPASAVLIGEWVAISVSEPMQGSDLDGDGAADGNVVQVVELATGLVRDLGLDAFVLHGSARRLFLAPFEELAGQDWNQDGDRKDSVLFDWSASDVRARNGGLVVASVLCVQGDHALVSARELDRGGDQDGDGDADDLVLELYDGRTGRATALGLAAGSSARLSSTLDVLALVDEAAQGRDLNADGDLSDEVLHVVRAAR